MDSYLVPSGRENGKARALTSDEEPANVLGQVVDAQQRDGRVMARVQPGMGIEPLRRWLAEGEQRREQRLQRLREEREHERADAQNALHLTAADAAPVHNAPPPPRPSPRADEGEHAAGTAGYTRRPERNAAAGVMARQDLIGRQMSAGVAQAAQQAAQRAPQQSGNAAAGVMARQDLIDRWMGAGAAQVAQQAAQQAPQQGAAEQLAAQQVFDRQAGIGAAAPFATAAPAAPAFGGFTNAPAAPPLAPAAASSGFSFGTPLGSGSQMIQPGWQGWDGGGGAGGN